MKKNNTGFTLIEMLAVIAILGVILTIAITGIGGIQNIFNQKYYNTLEGTTKIAAKDYYSDYVTSLPIIEGQSSIEGINDTIKLNKSDGKTTITYDDSNNNNSLKSLGYLEKKVVDTKHNVCQGYVITTKAKKDYTYKTCLNCSPNYTTNDCKMHGHFIQNPDDYYYQWKDNQTNDLIIINALLYNNTNIKDQPTPLAPSSYKIIKNSNEVSINDTAKAPTVSNILATLKILCKSCNSDTVISTYLKSNNITIQLIYTADDAETKTTNIKVISKADITLNSPTVKLYNDTNTTGTPFANSDNMDDSDGISYQAKDNYISIKYISNNKKYQTTMLCFDESNVPITCPTTVLASNDDDINRTYRAAEFYKGIISNKIPYAIILNKKTVTAPTVKLYQNQDSKEFISYTKDNFDDYEYKSGTITAKFTSNNTNITGYRCYDSLDSDTFESCTNGKTFNTNDSLNEVYYVSAVYNTNEESEKIPYLIKIDNSIPTIDFVVNGTKGLNNWYITSPVTFDITLKNSGPSNINDAKYCIVTGENDSCTPNQTATITNNKLTIPIESLKGQIDQYKNERDYGRTICMQATTATGIASNVTCYADNNGKRIKIDNITPNKPTLDIIDGTLNEDTGLITVTPSSLIKPSWVDNTISGKNYFRYNLTTSEHPSIEMLSFLNELISYQKPGSDFANDGIKINTIGNDLIFIYSVTSNAGKNTAGSKYITINSDKPQNPVITVTTTNNKVVSTGALINQKAIATITAGDNNAIYYCTSKDCTPSISDNKYESPLNLTNEGYNYLNAIACTTDNVCSSVSEFYVNIDTIPPTAPSFNAGNLDKQSTSDIWFTLQQGTDENSGIDKIKWSIDNQNWTTYSSAVTLLTNTGSQTVYAKNSDKAGNDSKVISATGYLNKDGIKVSKPIDYGSYSGEYYDIFLISNKNDNLLGTTKNTYEWAYWNVSKTTDTSNNHANEVEDKCGAMPNSDYIQQTTNSKIKIWLKYSKQYYCFAVRPYREQDITNINRWTVQYKHAKTSSKVTGNYYNGN